MVLFAVVKFAVFGHSMLTFGLCSKVSSHTDFLFGVRGSSSGGGNYGGVVSAICTSHHWVSAVMGFRDSV